MSNLHGKAARLAAVLGLAMALALRFAVPAHAAGKPTPQAPGAQSVAADAATGQLRTPTKAEAEALAAGIQGMLKRAPSTFAVAKAADGTISLGLGSSFLNILMAQVGPDGRLLQRCVNGPVDAKALFNVTAHVYEEK